MRVLVLILFAACAGERFGKIITEVAPSPDPHVLVVTSCDLIATSKADIDGVRRGDCQRYGVRRSPIVPVPLVEARVLAREHRIVTGFVERPAGGAVVTTCRIGQGRDKKWALLDCVDTEIATAPLETAPPLTPAGPPAPPPPVDPPATYPAPPPIAP